ncbi:hypothetical protein FACS1894187_05350 [Synergistales bacterium]|nr:hypothetical protein FACS1894187_05350 [Synergistales bacterium]
MTMDNTKMTRDNTKLLGIRIRELREKLGYSQEMLAEASMLSQNHISQVERGIKGLSRKSIIIIASVLNTRIDYLMGTTDDPSLSGFVQEHVAGQMISDMVLQELTSDPRKYAAAALIAGMDDEQLRKAYDFLFDQKRLAELTELLSQKGA